MADMGKDLGKLAKELATRKYTDGELFREIEGIGGHFGALVVKMRLKGLLDDEVAEELMQLESAKSK